MSANKYMKHLQKHDRLVSREYNPYAHILTWPQPSVNWIFGNTHGLPYGYSAIFYGPEASGKSIMCNAAVGQVHRDYDDGLVLKFNTEERELVQLTPHYIDLFGIDVNRYFAYETKKPEEIFDFIVNTVEAVCQDGGNIKLIIIDSITGILGRRQMNADSVLTMQRGDKAATIGEGLDLIQSVVRKHKIALLMTTQLRAEQDPVELMRGNTTRMQSAHQLRHFAEYFILVEPNKSKDGKVDLTGATLVNDELTDFKDKGEATALKIRATMKKSSLGPSGRAAEFTFDKNLGFINTHEEVFVLGTRRRIVDKPTQSAYVLSDWPTVGESTKWVGKDNFLAILRDDNNLCDEIVKRVRQQDILVQQTGQLPTFEETSEEVSD